MKYLLFAATLALGFAGGSEWSKRDIERIAEEAAEEAVRRHDNTVMAHMLFGVAGLCEYGQDHQR